VTATIDRAGLYRIGTVAAENRRASVALSSHPNPFPSASMALTVIEYEVDIAGPVRLTIVNALGQVVRQLVDQESQREGLWSVTWDGVDQQGRMSVSGVYYCELTLETGRTCLSLLLVR
jgi:flagellar hook assembly protein FlgD